MGSDSGVGRGRCGSEEGAFEGVWNLLLIYSVLSPALFWFVGYVLFLYIYIYILSLITS